MSIIALKFFHYLAIVFSGGVLVGGGLINMIYTKANKVPDINVAKVLKGLASLIILWITGLLLSNLLYGSLAINTAFTVKFIAAGFLLILSFAMNIHVYTASKNNLPPNRFIVKMVTMSSRGLIIIVLIGAAIAFN